MGFISTIQLQRKSTWCYSILLKPAEESSKLTKNHPPRQLMNDTFPACSLLQEGRLEDETLEAINKIVRVSKWCREAWKWFTLQKTPRQTTKTKHFNNLQNFTYLYCNIYSAFILRYKIPQRQTLCVSGWSMKEIKDVIQNKFPRHYLPLKLVRISNMMRFPQSRSKNYNWYTYPRLSWSSRDGVRWR